MSLSPTISRARPPASRRHAMRPPYPSFPNLKSDPFPPLASQLEPDEAEASPEFDADPVQAKRKRRKERRRKQTQPEAKEEEQAAAACAKAAIGTATNGEFAVSSDDEEEATTATQVTANAATAPATSHPSPTIHPTSSSSSSSSSSLLLSSHSLLTLLPLDTLILCFQFLPLPQLFLLSRLSPFTKRLLSSSAAAHKYTHCTVTDATLSCTAEVGEARERRRERELGEGEGRGEEGEGRGGRGGGRGGRGGKRRRRKESKRAAKMKAKAQYTIENAADFSSPPSTRPLSALQLHRLSSTRFSFLRGLTLSNCSLLTDSSLDLLLSHTPKLKLLQLRGLDHVTNACVGSMGRHLPKLRALQLNRVKQVDCEGVRALRALRLNSLTVGIARGGEVEEWTEAIASIPTLTRLYLQNCEALTDAALRRLTAGLPLLRDLTLTKWTDSYKLDLSAFLSSPSLARLSFLSCSLTDKDLRLLSSLPPLRHLSIASCLTLTNGALSSLSLSSSGLSSLSLHTGDTFSAQALREVLSSGGMRANLSELKLRGVVEAKGVEEVVGAVRRLRRLRKLNVAANGVLTDEVMRPLMLTDGEMEEEKEGTRRGKEEGMKGERVGGRAEEGEKVEAEDCVLVLREVNVVGCAALTSEFLSEWRARRRGMRLLSGMEIITASDVAKLHNAPF